MLQYPRLRRTRVWFVLSSSANAVAPFTPIGLYCRPNLYSLSFVHRAFASWHAPSELLLQFSRMRLRKVFGVAVSTEASEMVFWREKCELDSPSNGSVLWWNSLMISSTASGGRWLPLISRLAKVIIYSELHSYEQYQICSQPRPMKCHHYPLQTLLLYRHTSQKVT